MAVESVLSQYKAVLTSLEEMAPTVSDSGSSASEVLGELECLNWSLQKQSETIGGMQAAVAYVSSTLQGKRTEEKFAEVFEKEVSKIEDLGIEPFQIPYLRSSLG